jgi:hypothetical protein
MKSQLPTIAELVQQISEGIKQMQPAIERGIKNMHLANEKLSQDLNTGLAQMQALKRS